MSRNLPALPEPGGAVDAATMLRIENDAIRAIGHCNDITDAQQWLDQARALEAYVRGKELKGPVAGASRRIEGRIGQLLGPAVEGQPKNYHRDESSKIIKHSQTREDFRILARALDGECLLSPEEWRSSRRSLVKLIEERLGKEDIIIDLDNIENVFLMNCAASVQAARNGYNGPRNSKILAAARRAAEAWTKLADDLEKVNNAESSISQVQAYSA